MADNLHAKHRERVRKSFLADGFNENTPEHKILEMLLFYSISRKDTNELAHKLINRFGSLAAVLDAPVSELLKIEGVGENTAALIKLIMPVARVYMNSKNISSQENNYNFSKILDSIVDRYIGLTEETVIMTSFNNAGKILGYDVIGRGDISSVGISMRRIVETVVSRNATSVIISHNHPNGNAIPSGSDIAITEKITEALSNIDVKLIDHLIVADGDYVSMRQSSQFKYIFK